MNIALIGYGKMGKTIEQLALEKGHTIVLKMTSSNAREISEEQLRAADVCIEFSTPETAFENVSRCLRAGVPTVCGTTAWLDRLPEAEQLCLQHHAAFLYASNFSIGVNLFFRISEYAASLLSRHTQYAVSMEEIHHTQKKDAPSGTAVTLAEGILAQYPNKDRWVNHESGQPEELGIVSKRIDPAPGTHSVRYQCGIDEITLTHTAHSRLGFASGALTAAEFLHGKKGVFTMKEVLGL
jgi:4-hydroxy-tetrahydrodipicolinate reductase